MAAPATYGDDPTNSPLDNVRLLVGDTACESALLSDSEIGFFLTECGSPRFAAVKAAEAIAAKFARDVTAKAGGVTKNLSDRMQHYLDLASRLLVRANEQVDGAPIFTALERSSHIDDRLDESLLQPQFRIGQDDNPRQGANDNDESLLGLVP